MALVLLATMNEESGLSSFMLHPPANGAIQLGSCPTRYLFFLMNNAYFPFLSPYRCVSFRVIVPSGFAELVEADVWADKRGLIEMY